MPRDIPAFPVLHCFLLLLGLFSLPTGCGSQAKPQVVTISDPSNSHVDVPALTDAASTDSPIEQELSGKTSDSKIGTSADPAPTKPHDDPSPLESVSESTEPTEDTAPENPMLVRVTAAFPEPTGAKRLLDAKEGLLWADIQKHEVIVDGYVSLEKGPLELFACSAQTKEHEAVVGLLAPARFIHAALLAIEATPGHPVIYEPEFLSPAGQAIECEVHWMDETGAEQIVNAKDWVRSYATKESLKIDWVFAGSGWWEDPDTHEHHYMADSGDVICLSNFATSMLDLPISSSVNNDALEFEAFEGKIPPRGTPIRLIMRPLNSAGFQPVNNTKSPSAELTAE